MDILGVALLDLERFELCLTHKKCICGIDVFWGGGLCDWDSCEE